MLLQVVPFSLGDLKGEAKVCGALNKLSRSQQLTPSSMNAAATVNCGTHLLTYKPKVGQPAAHMYMGPDVVSCDITYCNFTTIKESRYDDGDQCHDQVDPSKFVAGSSNAAMTVNCGSYIVTTRPVSQAPLAHLYLSADQINCELLRCGSTSTNPGSRPTVSRLTPYLGLLPLLLLPIY
ncbi:hypothetical protein AAVH_31611 [Aphelenchoides avenae]|nr:hypothetical protein AAVH_31611 [Aphelenchus avenae]